jgi:hypothetical protein
LDPNYIPTTVIEEELFTKKQKYVDAILESKRITARGKSIVQAYEDTFDVQEVYKRHTEHHLKSTKARIESSTILSYITSVRLGSGEWNGSIDGLITHWTYQVQLYEWKNPISDHFSDGQNQIMLENSITPFSELRQVNNTEDLEQTKTGQSITHDKYLNLPLSAATAYYNQIESKKPKQNVFVHSIGDSDNYIHYNDISYIFMHQ